MTARILLTNRDRADQPPHCLARQSLWGSVAQSLRAAVMRSAVHHVRAVARSADTLATLALEVSESADGQRRSAVDIAPALELARSPNDTPRRQRRRRHHNTVDKPGRGRSPC